MVMATLNAAPGKSRAEYAAEIKRDLKALVFAAKRLLERGFEDTSVDDGFDVVKMSQFVPVVEQHAETMTNAMKSYHKAMGMKFILESMCRNSLVETLTTDDSSMVLLMEFGR
jgi:hypothetical protein